MESSRFDESKNKLKYIPQVFAYGMSGVNRKEFPNQGSGTANFVDGIPSIYSIAPSSGGKYVERADINGIGWLATQLQFFMQCGQFITFDQDFCSTVGGYPFGAILQTERKPVYGTDGTTIINYQSYWVMSLDENNTRNFNSDDNKDYIVTDATGKVKTTQGYWLRLTASTGDISDVKALITALTVRVTAVEQTATKAYKYKGQVAKKSDLDSIENPTEGDVYNVKSTGDNYAYSVEEVQEGEVKTHWDSLGKAFDLTQVYSDIATAKSEAIASSKTETETQISDKCLRKDGDDSNVKSAVTETSALGDNDIYNAKYINLLLSLSALTGTTAQVKGYTASFIDSTFATLTALSTVKEELEAEITTGGGEVTEAYKAADTALKNNLEGQIANCVKTASVKNEKVDDTAETATSDVYCVKYVNGIETKAQLGIDNAATAQSAAEAAQGTADGAVTAASSAQSTADDAKTKAENALYQLDEDKEDSEVRKLLDRISGLEQRLATVEEWIKRHGSTTSDDIG